MPEVEEGKEAPPDPPFEIPLRDFAKSLIIFMPFTKFNKYADRI